VVVCNGTPKSFEDREDADALLRSCNGIADEKATVLVEADVRAVIDLGELSRDDVEIDGTTIRLTLPEPTLADPSVDAETGVLIVGLDTSIFPGKLPDDYLSDAAAEGKRAVNGVAERSGLLDLAKSSASSLFESLLTSLGFTDVEIVFANPSGGA